MYMTDEEQKRFYKAANAAAKEHYQGVPTRITYPCPLCGGEAYVSIETPTFGYCYCTACHTGMARGLSKNHLQTP